MCTAKRVVRGFDREKQERGDFAGICTHGVRPVAFVPEATPTKASTVAYRAQMQLRMALLFVKIEQRVANINGKEEEERLREDERRRLAAVELRREQALRALQAQTMRASEHQ